jgi:hypothetical protein
MDLTPNIQKLTMLLTAKVLGMVVSGGVSLIALCVWESFQGENAFFAVHLFKDVRGFGMNCICSAVGGISYVALSIIWPTRKCPFLP